jgi:hypothetical protein
MENKVFTANERALAYRSFSEPLRARAYGYFSTMKPLEVYAKEYDDACAEWEKYHDAPFFDNPIEAFWRDRALKMEDMVRCLVTIT